MRRGTTPTLTFTLPFDCSQITLLNIAFAQDENIVLEKSLEDCTIADNTLIVELSEEDTLRFDGNNTSVKIQLRVGIGETRLASNIIYASVEDIIKDGRLE